MTNMDKVCKKQLSRENEINWQEVGLNNNTEDEKNKEQGDCQVMKPKDKQLLQKHETLGNHNENTEASSTILDEVVNDSFSKPAVLTPNSNCSSANNSTDNLSYLSDSCVIEEVLILPNNLSDEEISVNSDDCVYAYRGADYDISDQRAVPPDDETDFLEMDFDPDPPSEIEHNNESNSRVANPDCGFSGEETKGPGPTSFESEPVVQGTVCEKLTLSNGLCTTGIQDGGNPCEISKYSPRQTGTKPKKVFSDRGTKVSKLNKFDEPFSVAMYRDEAAGCAAKEPDEACLDCLEKEFLLKTIGKKMEPFQCSKCNSKISYSSQGHSTPYKTFGFTDLPLLEDSAQFLQRNNQRNPPCNTAFGEKLLVTATKKETVSFLSVEADEVTIVQALEKIDATFNRDIIRSFFDTRHKIFVDVPELIVYMSKKNCDYKRIIKLIKSASMSELEITFSPNKKVTKAELVQVSAFDILQSWTRRSDLGKLKKLDKRFSYMNVLGKIANLVRQAQQRNANILNEFIAIPQYYETGYITINKK